MSNTVRLRISKPFTRSLKSRASLTSTGSLSYPIVAALLLASASISGCGKTAALPVRKVTREEAALKARREIPGQITGTVWHIHWMTKAPEDKHAMQTVALADADHGGISDPDNPTITLYDVQAKIFKDGVQTGTVHAPVAEANQRDKILNAVGGVILTSASDPPDTTITGDEMTWDTTRNRLVVSGNARARVTKPGQKPDTTSGDRLVFDTKLKEIRNE